MDTNKSFRTKRTFKPILIILAIVPLLVFFAIAAVDQTCYFFQSGQGVVQSIPTSIIDHYGFKAVGTVKERAFDTQSGIVVRTHLFTSEIGSSVSFRNHRYDEIVRRTDDGRDSQVLKMDRGQYVLWSNGESVVYLEYETQKVITMRISDRAVVRAEQIPPPGMPERYLYVRIEGGDIVFSLTGKENRFYSYPLPSEAE